MNVKHIHNATDQPLRVTLEVREASLSAQGRCHSHTVPVAAGEQVRVAYGDLCCNFLAGLVIEAELADSRLCYQQQVQDPQGRFARQLNGGSFISITALQPLTLETDA